MRTSITIDHLDTHLLFFADDVDELRSPSDDDDCILWAILAVAVSDGCTDDSAASTVVNTRSGVMGAEVGVIGVNEVIEAWNSSRQSSVPGDCE